VIEIWDLFLLDQVFENADIFGLRNLDSKRLIRLVTENKAVEREKLRGIGYFRNFKEVRKRNIITYKGALSPRCEDRLPKDH